MLVVVVVLVVHLKKPSKWQNLTPAIYDPMFILAEISMAVGFFSFSFYSHQSINQPTNQSMIQSINQSTSPSVNQSEPTRISASHNLQSQSIKQSPDNFESVEWSVGPLFDVVQMVNLIFVCNVVRDYSETIQTMPMAFAVKKARLKVYAIMASLMTLISFKVRSASQTWLLCNLQYLEQYVSYYIQTWHDGRLTDGIYIYI